MENSSASGKNDYRLIANICFRLLPAQIVLAVVGAINGMICGLFASNFIGSHAMSVVGLYNPVRLFVVAVGVMIVGGTQVIMGKHMGNGETKEMRSVFSANILLSAIVGLCVTLFLVFCVLFGFMGIFVNDPEMQGYLSSYFLGNAIGIFPQIFGQQLAGLLSMENQKKYTTAASVACILSTGLLNYLFIEVLDLGIFGLALASSGGMWVFFLVQCSYYAKGRKKPRIRFVGIRLKQCLDILKTGLPGALTEAYLVVRTVVVNGLLLEYSGEISVAAFATSNSFMEVFWAIPIAMHTVSRMMFSLYSGEEDRQSMQNVMRVAFYRCAPLILAISSLIAIFSNPATMLYYRDVSAPVFEMTAIGLRILPFSMPFSIICEYFVCYGQTCSDKSFLTHMLSFIDGMASVILFSVILVPSMGVYGVYAANVLNGVMTTVAIIAYAWVKNRSFPRTIEKLMVFSDDFGVSEEDRIDITIRSTEEVVRISEKIQRFCLNKGIDERRSFFAALAVEEMAGNVVSHGFTKDRKKHSVDIRVTCKGDTLILRIKDDCKPFNPEEYKNLTSSPNTPKNIGIPLVFALCKDVKYSNLMGMNALIIKL